MTQSRGRPTRWCSSGCKAAGEAEIRRLGTILAKFEEGRAVDALNGHTDQRRAEVIADLSGRLDRLYGVEVQEVAADE
ncbi:hypothetical protein ACLQ3C_09250 [Gordonia sp. DT30]|uniref:hypothetical protein n=1 Tax=Gordonia sp. DT30 TaxID=3416546 RepID=UPI003CF58AED